MRRGAVQLVRQDGQPRPPAASGAKPPCAYVLVNNSCEGNAPLTVEALAEMLRPK